MEIKIPKEVREYHETIFFGLNTRQFVCSLLAVGVAVAVYFLLQPMLDTEEIGWVCILAAAPFAVCGFFTYHGMTPEQLLWAWCKSELLCPKRLVFRSDSYYYAAMQPAIQAGLHAEIDERMVKFHMADVSAPVRKSRMALRELENQLEDDGFLRIHNSFLVNMNYISSLQTNGVTLTIGQTLPISLHGYRGIKKKYMVWRGRG